MRKAISCGQLSIVLFGVLFSYVTSACSSEKETHHPFLIVKKDQYQSLREKSDKEPWKSMMDDAISRSGKGSDGEPYDLQYYVGAAALAYVLDQDNAQTHANRVRDAILNRYSAIEFKDDGDWGGVVPPMGSAYVAILALDIVYDALTIEEIAACEEVISTQISKIGRKGPWVGVRLGTHGVWDIYKGDRTGPDDDYFSSVMLQITDDGVSPVANHYAWERVGGGDSRISKSGYMDVLEFTGFDRRYYSNEKLKKFHKWLFGSSVNCAKEMAIFGDMLPTQGIGNDMLHRRVVNFDMEAAGYAAWFHEGRPAYGNILTYILPMQELPMPVVPSSRIYENGGAFFREKEDNNDGLHAVLYNIKSQDEWHTHQEVNGLAISGYGNRLMVNGGRLGESTRAANLNNTLTINGNDHSARTGGGIVEGFTADELDYSSGFSGQALTDAIHYRNMVLVHGVDAHPYVILFDEVEADPGDRVKHYLHPANQSSVNTISQGMEYEAAIDHYPTSSGAKLSFFFGTPAAEVNIEKVASAVPDRYPGYPDHNRLESVYDTDADGMVNIVTVLFPHTGTHAKPSISRISEIGLSGCSMDHDASVRDVILESKGDQDVVFDDITFYGKSMFSRSSVAGNILYFVRHGRKYAQGGIGYESDAVVSIYAKGTEGVIISGGARIKFNGEGMNTINFSPSADIISSGTDFIEVQLPVGEVRFR